MGDAAAASPSWWPQFFDLTYAGFGLVPRDPAQVTGIVDFLIAKLQLQPGMTVFDQCCGIGRLSLPLAERGMRTIGVDLIPPYIAQAAAEAKSRGFDCRFHRGDAFEFIAPEPCDAAFNWFTSFGYLEDDEMNRRMMQRVFESLKPGGRFLLDYLNMPRILTEFHPSYLQWQNPEDRGGLVVLTENKMDFARGMMDSLWTFVHGDGRREPRPVVTRMFMPHELARMLRRCGFDGIELFGSVAGEPFGLRSARCIVLARKP